MGWKARENPLRLKKRRSREDRIRDSSGANKFRFILRPSNIGQQLISTWLMRVAGGGEKSLS
jgi:hypothetical protein